MIFYKTEVIQIRAIPASFCNEILYSSGYTIALGGGCYIHLTTEAYFIFVTKKDPSAGNGMREALFYSFSLRQLFYTISAEMSIAADKKFKNARRFAFSPYKSCKAGNNSINPAR